MIIHLDLVNGYVVPDALIESTMRDALKKGEDITIGSDMMLTAIRYLKKREFKDLELQVKYKDYSLIAINNEGRLERWYPGMDRMSDWLAGISRR